MAGLSNAGSGGGSGAIRAGRAFVEMFLNDNAVYRALDRLKARFQSFGSLLGKAGAGLAAGGSALLAPLVGLFKSSADRAADIDRLATKLGVPAEKLAQFAGAAELTGVTLDDLTGHFENWAERVYQGAQGTGEAAEAFKRLGIDASQLQLLDPVDQLIALSEAMQQVTNDTERLGLLSSFGGDQFQWLNALLKQGPTGIREAMGKAAPVGAEFARQATEISTAWTEARLALQSALLPLIQYLVPAVKLVKDFVVANAEVARVVAVVAAGVVAAGVAVAGLGLAFIGLGAAIGGAVVAAKLLAATLALLVSTPVLIGAAIATLSVAVAASTEEGQGALLRLQDGFWEAFETAKVAFAGIGDAIRAGDWGLAMKIAGTALQLEWAKVVRFWTGYWNAFKDFFVDGWHWAVLQVSLVLNDLVAVARQAFEYVGTAIGNTFRWIAEQAVWLALQAAKALDAVNPTGALKGTIGRLKGVLAGVDEGAREQAWKDLEAQYALIERQRKGIEDQLRQAYLREQAARRDARQADLDAAQADVARLQQELLDLRGQAAAAATAARAKPDPVQEAVQRLPNASQLEQAARGSFTLSSAQQRFGLGDTLSKKIEKNTNATAQNTGDMATALRDFVNGFRFR